LPLILPAVVVVDGLKLKAKRARRLSVTAIGLSIRAGFAA
jgi:hypothetical protein